MDIRAAQIEDLAVDNRLWHESDINLDFVSLTAAHRMSPKCQRNADEEEKINTRLCSAPAQGNSLSFSRMCIFMDIYLS